MQLFVRTPCGRCIPVHVDGQKPVSHVKELIERVMGRQLHPQQRLTFADEHLDDNYLINSYNLAHGNTLFLTVPQGGSERIFIQRAEGGKFPISVNPVDSIGAVKKKIEEKEGIPICQQSLIFFGLELMDDWTLEECSVRNDGILNLVLRPDNKIFVEVFNGAMFPVAAWPTDTVRRVKERIEQIRGYPLNRQRLRDDWRELEDSYILQDVGISDQSVVHLSLRNTRPPVQVFVNCGKRGTLTLHLEPSTDIGKVKEIIHERTGVLPAHQSLTFNGPELSAGSSLEDYQVMDRAVLLLHVNEPPIPPMELKVETMSGACIVIKARPSESVEFVKTEIRKREGIQVNQQILVFNGEHLNDSRPLSDYSLVTGSRLQLLLRVRPEIKVFLKSEGLPVQTFIVEPSDTVYNLKVQIEEKTGVLICDQRLIYAGKLLEDQLQLVAYSIQQDSTIFLNVCANRVRVSVETLSGSVIHLSPDLGQSVASLKEQILEKEGIPVPLQHLTFNGKPLADSGTLADYRIPDGAVLRLVVRLASPMHVFVRCQNGRTLKLDVEPTHSVAAVRHLVHDQTGLPFKQIRLVFNNQMLLDSNLLRHHDVFHGCTLYLDHRPVRTFPVYVALQSGKRLTLHVNRGWRVRDVKAEIGRLEDDYSLNEQRLSYDGVDLSDERKLKEYGVRERSTLQLCERATMNGSRPDVFISYQWDRQKTVKGLFLRLTELGYSCWMDESEMGGGDKLFDEIDRGLRECKVVIACVTPNYTKSTNCRREICRADNLKKPIIPIMLDETEWLPEGPMAMIFTELLYIDFYSFPDQMTNWDGVQVDKLMEQLNKYVSARPM